MFLAHRHVADYDRDAIQAALQDMLAPQGGLETLLAGRERILLKPNFVAPEGRDGCSTTNPDFYMAVAEMLLALGKEVTIADSPAFGSAAMQVRLHGVWGECRAKGIRVLTFRNAREVAGVEADSKFGELTIARELRDFDAMVNLPKLKVHCQFVFTAATKNLYGCVTGKRKAYRHFVCENDPVRFGRMILANARAAAPVLNLGDGIISMHRKGPRGGAPFPLRTILASDDTLAHDAAFCAMIGLEPMSTPLYRALEVEDPAHLAAVTALVAPIADAADFPRAEGYEMSPESPIEFSSFHMLRSIWRSLKTGS